MYPMSKSRQNADQYKAKTQAVRRANRIMRQERREEAKRLAQQVVEPSKVDSEAKLSRYKRQYATAAEAVRACVRIVDNDCNEAWDLGLGLDLVCLFYNCRM